ncbi:MFS transporter [Trichophyton mentagrophytes]|uniref:Major facilitator superfamily (MFS) profile domain-containing protein n=1 Tax=Trichophyton interdigitale (strain MR816) TaxID=1215338 RepID=A0A059J6H2_TRIIM|nr:hypothetical protein H101_05445 [Trichophyton interdigitale H6]KAG5204518.1 putative MFS-type transporter [Trichophyton interdigitale]KDB23077.1 hypothetical protein H109_05035 [Trichophyton interdigitale MR816]GBF66551.1 MFS transporter [Trichophyton mentagrophytes]KAG5216994.1 putative MFS-type transporter [Trichophyton interdigitale]
MADEVQAGTSPAQSDLSKEEEAAPKPGGIKWTRYLGLKGKDSQALEERWAHREKWSMGILSDKQTDEVPGTILLLAAKRNEPLGLRNTPARTSATSLPSPYPPSRGSSRGPAPPKKRTADGAIVLDPQPEESMNDPLNWPMWRRDLAMLCLGFYCMLGGGMTPILAAAYNEVSAEYDISFHKVALTTGLYMLGLGLGSVVMSPTAILYGKRPVYIAGATMFIISAVWCAVSPSYVSLVIARIFQGLAVSPVECLPSATIAEIYFLHERAYRVGVYTLLLLGGKNLIPLVSAAITNSLGWRWIFWMVAITTAFSAILVFLFVPETFWDRTPRPRAKRPHMRRSMSDIVHTLRGRSSQPVTPGAVTPSAVTPGIEEVDRQLGAVTPRKHKNAHVGFAENEKAEIENDTPEVTTGKDTAQSPVPAIVIDPEAQRSIPASRDQVDPTVQLSQQQIYTSNLRAKPPVSFIQSLKPWNGRIAKDNWFRVMARPLILFAYPAVLWSSMVYALSVGWLIVLSESVAEIYAKRDTYNFTPLQVGLVYISPFVAGILGTIVAGRVSDIVVRFMSRRNGGVYEPEFRLVMGLPSTLATTIGLMGFGWSAQEKDNWIVPTVFFGILSFGCTLGSTTSITYCVDSYRQYAGEALVTLNFSKNVLHGFVFSLFFVQWLQADGAKDVFVALGGIHLALMLFTIPLYIYGKRARMWTVRKHLMEKF